MDNVTLNNITESCRKELLSLSIGSGLEQLKIIARYCSDKQIISQVEDIEDNYHSMLSFLAGGGKTALFCPADGIRPIPWASL